MKRRWTRRPVKIGTMAKSVVWVTTPLGGFRVGKVVQWRETLSGSKWQEARIWHIGPPPECMLFLEL